MEGWKVRIERPIYRDRIDFYCIKHESGYTKVLQPSGSIVMVPEGQVPPETLQPTFSISGYDGKQLMQALAEALSEEGIKGPNDHAVRGQLEAQTAHLNDLRTLLKLHKSSGVTK